MIEGARMPTEEERQSLCRMLDSALLEIRALSLEGKAQRAADLADAFHYLQVYLWSDRFSFAFFRSFIESYHQKHTDFGYVDYIEMIDEITNSKA